MFIIISGGYTLYFLLLKKTGNRNIFMTTAIAKVPVFFADLYNLSP
jgi:hypothetical protein